MAAAKASTRRSTLTSAVGGKDSNDKAGTAARTNRKARASPEAPARRHRTRPSVRRCAMRRPRLAPSEARTAISFRRAAPLVSSRLATLAQAISSTITTAPKAT